MHPLFCLKTRRIVLTWNNQQFWFHFDCPDCWISDQVKKQWVWQDLDHTVYARQAYQGGAYTYLLEMLKSESFQEPDVSICSMYYMYLLENAK